MRSAYSCWGINITILLSICLLGCKKEASDGNLDPGGLYTVKFIEEVPWAGSWVRRLKDKIIFIADANYKEYGQSGVYDPASNKVEKLTLRGAGGSTVVLGDNYLVLAGGSSGPGKFFLNARIVDINDMSINVGEISKGRNSIVGVAHRDFMMFAGGTISYGENDLAFSNVIDVFTPSNNWTVEKLSVERAYIAGASAGGKIIFAGGLNNDGASDVVDIFDVEKKMWSTAKLSVPRYNIGATVVGDYVLLAGGDTEAYRYSKIIDIYNVKTNEWTTESLSQERSSLTAITVGNKAVFIGGFLAKDSNADNRYSRVIDIFDPFTKKMGRAELRKEDIMHGESVSVGNKFYVPTSVKTTDVYELQE